MSGFIDFPPKHEIVASLEGIARREPWRRELIQAVADRLGSRVYDGAACMFILMETLFEFEDCHGLDLRPLLAQCIVVLTGDSKLAQTALESFDEIHRLIAS